MKKRIICICAILLMVLLLIVGISCCNGNSYNSGDSEQATTSGTEYGANPSTPEEGTTGPEVQPSGTEPPVNDPSEPEVPEVTPSEPEVPEIEPSEPDEPETDPVDPEIPEEQPSEPEVPAPKPSEPETSKPTEPPKPVEYIQGNGYKRVKDFDPATNTGERGFYINGEGIFRIYEDEYIFEVTAGTLTYEMWCSWDTFTQHNFTHFCYFSSDDNIDDKYNFRRITECDNYTCGWEDHYCYSDADHEDLVIEMARGCDYCGKKDCISFLAREETGFTATDIYSCPEYDAHKDPSRYCQHCGYRKWGEVIPGEIQCTRQMRYDQPCLYCDEMTYINQCHHCVVPADYVPSKPGHFHVYNKQITHPTCTKPGSTRYVCSCGDSSKGEEIPAPGHAYGDWVVVKEATADEQGVEETTCATCGKVLSRTFAFCTGNDDTETIAYLHEASLSTH